MAAFHSLYEEKVRIFIDIIDEMRSMGVDKEVSLPTIVVVGDQSSGKSSVLEMLSEISLPRGNGIATRCPLELKLKKVEGRKPWKGQISYKQFVKTLDDPTQLEAEILKAQDVLAENKSISSELISVLVESTVAPDLTLIDLPGIVRVAVGNQPQDIGEKTRKLIKNYIEKKETIILVVIPCTVDIATTEALKLAQEVDPDGQRTLGVLTKPDLIDEGTEKEIIKIIENNVIPLKKGYILVKCRGQKKLNITASAAMEEEKAFLQNNEFFRPLLEKGFASFKHLSDKLTSELIQQIMTQLPVIENEIREKIIEVKIQQEKLGTITPEEDEAKSVILNYKVLSYCEEIANLVAGDYQKDYENGLKICDYSRHLFSEWYGRLESEKVKFNEEAITKVKHHEKNSKGRELPGFTKYRIFETIVREHIQKLLAPALQLMKELADKTHTIFNKIGLEHFGAFPNLLRTTKDIIAVVRQMQEQGAEQMLRMHFKMEDMVYAPDAMYSFKLTNTHSSSQHNLNANHSVSGNLSLILVSHLQTYYQIVIDRLVQMIPMVTKYHLLQEFSKEVKLKMTQTILKEESHSDFLQEDDSTTRKRKDLNDTLQRLTNARNLLICEENSRI
ncbi:interferon-induced GTP-binding protein Mx3-like [Pristis pectinata]|uniref:interferon-induced GTP-binding protein Mx3-like n=1 Tax=Pristis pectinata TaxID=685728 RepID=UPI00223D8669|nr:interferon-induced GTP-binding protein Mx3-like [Pristis pectinata]XP_051869302.1 interferon-induced GTP-binding protein Mx3-like [Pristis pectinata]XP_051869303.1 interferon-induced GTP-binding protein Mx3-like [Pristis pectinata]XP_051869304.1 interferon-induced GTP-binding protein Mx3-like [Pristis pectinata]